MPTPNLALAYLEPAQAQKHVTVNENTRLLDALIQAGAHSRTLLIEPASPADGDIYILPAGKTGAAWGAMANHAVAYYRDGVWAQLTPREGWTFYVKNEDQHVVYSGAAWGPLMSAAQTAGFRNRLMNSAFAINQRAATSAADDAYGFDRWYVLTSTGSVTLAALTDPESGRITGIRMTQPDVSAKRIGLAQIVESANIRDLRSLAVAMAARVRCSASQAIRMAILEWTGTADTVTSDVVNDWTSASFTAGGFFTSTTLNVIATGASTPAANTWTDVTQITGSFGASLNNAIVMVWTEGTLAQNGTLDIDQMQLEPGALCGAFARRPLGEELALCQRYFYRAQQPAWRGSVGPSGVGNRVGGTHPVTMHAAPSMTVSGSLPVFDGANVSTATAITVNYSTALYAEVDLNSAGLTQGNPYAIYQNGSAYVDVSAEL